MNDTFHIQYLPHNEIDMHRWDSCIERANNGLIYSHSIYLDFMSKNWDALVLNDYEAVMPLTWNKKAGIYYLYQPFLTAQSGIIGNAINTDLVDQFLDAIPGKFRYWDICLNQGNVFPSGKYPLFLRSNFVLDLDQPYSELYKEYNDNIKRNIKKAEQAGCYIQKDFEIEKVTELAAIQMKHFARNVKEGLARFKSLYYELHQKSAAITYGAYLNRQLMASCVVLKSHNRIYYVLVGNSTDGKAIGASHAVIDSIIKDFSGTKSVLDFEGSDIPGLAAFYRSFGSVEEKYSALRLNRLPFYLKWLKK